MTSVNGVQTQQNTGGIISDKESLQSSYSQFLTLLTTQLQHQDPTSPMDTAQFTSQLVSFSQVEQQLKTNNYLEKLANSTANNQATLALGYIGLNVNVLSNKFDFDPAVYTSATVGYNVGAGATNSTINILDKNGQVIQTASGSAKAGDHTFTWDGKDKNGQVVAAGTYTVQVSAFDANKNPVSTFTKVPGQVTGMQTAADGSIELLVGSQFVPLSSIVSAFLPVSAPAPTGGEDTTGGDDNTTTGSNDENNSTEETDNG